jgi:hypothetical protein
VAGIRKGSEWGFLSERSLKTHGLQLYLLDESISNFLRITVPKATFAKVAVGKDAKAVPTFLGLNKQIAALDLYRSGNLSLIFSKSQEAFDSAFPAV